MYARVIQVHLLPDTAPAASEHFRQQAGPALKQQAGFLNSRFLTNPAHQCLMVTLWESEASRQGAENNGFLQEVLQQLGQYFASKPTIDYYQVDVQVA